jgi:hypothetical protein
MATTPPVFRHLEAHFGRIDSSVGYWRFPLGGQWLQVVAYRDQPRPGTITLCSLGLFHHELCSPTGHVRQELVLACETGLAADGRLASLFPCVGEAVLANRMPLVPGQIFGPLGPVIAEVSPLEWLMCLPPRPFPQSFAVCEGTDPVTHFTWLVPISVDEAEEVRDNNLASLEHRWGESGVDLLDWQRSSRKVG